MILAGDIGGTSSRLGLFRHDGNRVTSLMEQHYSSQKMPSLEALIDNFLAKIQASNLPSLDKNIHVACFGIAGPVKRRHNGQSYVEMTNIPHWPPIEEQALSTLLHGINVTLLNDMLAICYGIEILDENELVVLNPGIPQAGNRALIAAGTGLGEAILYWDGNRYHPMASEGGHTDFAPRNTEEIELLLYLLKKMPHVSYEQVVSGPGLVNIYEFIRDSAKYGRERAELAEHLRAQVSNNGEDHRPSLISAAALKQEDSLVIKTLDLFVALYGAEAGNLALKSLALNGIYIGGGIAPRILEKLFDDTFMKNFIAKGDKYAQLMADIPVKVILNPSVGLMGAAWYATN